MPFQEKILLGCLFCTLLIACYKPKEGCLDIRAANYDVSADEACAECCKYPLLTVAFRHGVVLPAAADTFITFRYQTPYPSPYDASHYFTILRSRFFLSGFRLINEEGKEFPIMDSIVVEAPKGKRVIVENNFAKVDRDIFQPAAIGPILAKGKIRALKFQFGLPAALRLTEPASLPRNHPLSTSSDTLLYDKNTGYKSHLMLLLPDTSANTTALPLIFVNPKEILLPLPQPFVLEQGFNVRITLRINYLSWFEGIDLKNSNVADIMSRMHDNVEKGFVVQEIKME